MRIPYSWQNEATACETLLGPQLLNYHVIGSGLSTLVSSYLACGNIFIIYYWQAVAVRNRGMGLTSHYTYRFTWHT
jgi:hypothetical protein